MIDFRELIKAGTYFGHQTSRWNPKMAPYIWGQKNGIHLIDVSKTALQLEKAAQFLESVATQGKSILWVGTKKPAQEIVFSTATRLKLPWVDHRWIGGILSNFMQVKKSVTRFLHYEDVLVKSEKFPHYTKKELNSFQKIVNRLKKNVGGIRTLSWPVGAIVIIDVRKEQAALKEALSIGVPVVALVDTNNDPSMIDYVIPGNDDAPRAIKIIIDYLALAVERGMKAAVAKQEQKSEMQTTEHVLEEEIVLIPGLELVDEEELNQSQKRTKKSALKVGGVSEDEKSSSENKKERGKTRRSTHKVDK